MKSIRLFISIFVIPIFSISGLAQTGLKSPNEFLPHNLGEQFTPHHLVVDYFKHVAAASENIVYKEYGKTNEDRTLIYTIISAKENLSNLEQIRTDNLKRIGLLPGKPVNDKAIAIVWLSHGVHGNEASASEASMATIHALAQMDNPLVQGWLENAVVILDPCINPDGYSRYTHWMRMVSNKKVNVYTDSREHAEPWPGGRTNHYYFDLNRDWAWLTQIESQQRVKIYHDWMPHVHADFHEMGYNSHYYFAPGAIPYHDYISDWQVRFQDMVGKNHAKYFDEKGWLYFTKETYDLFYPGFGDTYPTFNGSIGMTYEQAGGSRAGRGVIMNNKDTLKLSDRVEHHHTTGLSTIEVAANNAELLVENFEKYFNQSTSDPKGKFKSYIIKGNNPKFKLKNLAKFLDQHGIQYGKNGSGKSINAFSYAEGRNEQLTIQKNDLIISAYQPMSVLAQVLLEPEHAIEDSITYDITAWSVPLAFGLDAYASTEKVKVDPGYNFPAFNSGIQPTDNPYAFLFEWNSFNSSKFLAAVLQEGIVARYAEKVFSLGGKDYNEGTILINRGDNRKLENQISGIIARLSEQFQHQVDQVTSGYASRGSDLGSKNMRIIKTPKVVVVAGDRVSSSSFGQIWHLLENDLDYPLSVWSPDQLQSGDLDQYNTLILPSGYYRIDENTVDKISSWASSGGKVIAIGSALSKFENESGFTLSPYASDSEKSQERNKRNQEKLDERLENYAHRERRSISNRMPGAIYKVNLDNSHPLAFGLPDHYFSLKTSTRRYSFLKDTWNVGYIDEDPLIYGFAGSKAKERMKETTVFAVQRKGSGKIIYMVDNPLYRGFWRQGKFLFSNAFFF